MESTAEYLVHQFRAVHFIVCLQIEIHVEGKLLCIVGFQQTVDAVCNAGCKRHAENAEAPVAAAIAELFKGIFFQVLIRIGFPAQRMVHEKAVVLDAYDAAVRIGMVSPAQMPQAFAGEIGAGAGNDIALLQQLLGLANGCRCVAYAGIGYLLQLQL